jgi:hypothetical protein
MSTYKFVKQLSVTTGNFKNIFSATVLLSFTFEEQAIKMNVGIKYMKGRIAMIANARGLAKLRF